jgi:hypothetical protein
MLCAAVVGPEVALLDWSAPKCTKQQLPLLLAEQWGSSCCIPFHLLPEIAVSAATANWIDEKCDIF